MAPKINPTPVSAQASNPSSRSPHVIIIVIVLILAAVLIAIWLRKSGMGLKTDRQKSGELSEDQRAQLLENLSQNNSSSSTPLTNTQRGQLMDNLSQDSSSNKPLTDAERAQLLKSLQQ